MQFELVRKAEIVDTYIKVQYDRVPREYGD